MREAVGMRSHVLGEWYRKAFQTVGLGTRGLLSRDLELRQMAGSGEHISKRSCSRVEVVLAGCRTVKF